MVYTRSVNSIWGETKAQSKMDFTLGIKPDVFNTLMMTSCSKGRIFCTDCVWNIDVLLVTTVKLLANEFFSYKQEGR